MYAAHELVSDEELEALRPLCEAPPASEHVLHMPETHPFSVKPGYNYLRADPGSRRLLTRLHYVCERAFWNFILVLIVFIDRVFLGLRIEGQENLKGLGGRGFVSVCNHVHMMDCTMAALALAHKRIFFVTLESNFRIPVIRHLVRALGGVPLPASPACMREMTAAMRTAVAEGFAVHLYPEGVLQPYAGTLRPFRKGAFTLAASIGAPVLPMAICYRRPRGLYALWKRRPCLTLRILPPVYPDPSQTPAAAARDLRLRAFYSMFRAMEE